MAVCDGVLIELVKLGVLFVLDRILNMGIVLAFISMSYFQENFFKNCDRDKLEY